VSPGLEKFVDPLPIFGSTNLPLATPVANVYSGVDYYEMTAGAYRQVIHSKMNSLPGFNRYSGTRFYGYKNTTGGTFAHLGGGVIANKGTPVRIKFTNALPATHMLPFDPTIPSPGNGGARQDRIAIHLHGGLDPWTSDGGPFHWFANPLNTGGEQFGASVINWLPNTTGTPTFDIFYPNLQSARLMWYHDHAIGITRTNAYAGLAAPYILADSLFEAGLGLPGGAPQYLVFQDKIIWDPANDPNYTAPANVGGGGVTEAQAGDLWYPYIYEPAIWKLQGRGKAPVPSAVPEMAGDTMLVNGHVFPFHMVTAGAQRFRWLNACNTRFLNLQFVMEDPANPGEPLGGYAAPTLAPVDVWIIGTEGGYLPAPVKVIDNGTPFGGVLNPLLTAPAERLDVIVDFTGLSGKNVLLYSDAQTPYPLGNPGFDYFPGNLLNPVQPTPGFGPNTRTLMLFEVGGNGSSVTFMPTQLEPAAAFLPTVADTLNGGLTLPDTTLGALYTVNGITYTFAGVRNLTLNEGFDGFGRLIQEIGTTVKFKKGKFGRTYLDAPSETVKYGTVEIWNIFNLTADTHPMHTHLFNGMVLRRQLFKMQNFQGTPVFTGPGRGPEPYEIGWKETFQCPPGEVTVLAVLVEDPMPATVYSRDTATGRPTVSVTPSGGGTFTGVLPFSTRLQTGYAITGDEFVWHCHILEHEEHDMMRPLVATY
jgi:spore coat protein A